MFLELQKRLTSIPAGSHAHQSQSESLHHAYGGRQLWIWDLETPDVWIQPAPTATDGASLAGTAALALTRAVAEALAQAVAAGWHSGVQVAARFGLLPLAAEEAAGSGVPTTPLQQQAGTTTFFVALGAELVLVVVLQCPVRYQCRRSWTRTKENFGLEVTCPSPP